MRSSVYSLQEGAKKAHQDVKRLENQAAAAEARAQQAEAAAQRARGAAEVDAKSQVGVGWGRVGGFGAAKGGFQNEAKEVKGHARDGIAAPLF